MNILKYKDNDGKRQCYFVKVSSQEALRIVESLTRQILARSPNVGRVEFYTRPECEYFSIAVNDELAIGTGQPEKKRKR